MNSKLTMAAVAAALLAGLAGLYYAMQPEGGGIATAPLPPSPSTTASRAAGGAESPRPMARAAEAGATTRLPAPAGAAARTSVAPTLLAPEQGLVHGSSLSGKALAQVFAGEHYEDLLRKLDAQAARDVEANAQAQLYRAAIEGLVKRFQGLQLTGLACGLTVCLGSLRTATPATYDRWADALYRSGQPPHYSFVDHRLSLGPEQYEYRFAFSVDPGVNGVSAAP